jgi:hypothetical protein
MSTESSEQIEPGVAYDANAEIEASTVSLTGPNAKVLRLI